MLLDCVAATGADRAPASLVSVGVTRAAGAAGTAGVAVADTIATGGPTDTGGPTGADPVVSDTNGRGVLTGR